ncbi:hypothetical protein ACE2AJ_14620 [Aquihabitans daechungensis]|uniref:hypothetical protein n=1 Tax=Aquihabitans daechungensis TaxID=1052257 RepID=UPI003BA17FD4
MVPELDARLVELQRELAPGELVIEQPGGGHAIGGTHEVVVGIEQHVRGDKTGTCAERKGVWLHRRDGQCLCRRESRDAQRLAAINQSAVPRADQPEVGGELDRLAKHVLGDRSRRRGPKPAICEPVVLRLELLADQLVRAELLEVAIPLRELEPTEVGRDLASSVLANGDMTRERSEHGPAERFRGRSLLLRRQRADRSEDAHTLVADAAGADPADWHV